MSSMVAIAHFGTAGRSPSQVSDTFPRPGFPGTAWVRILQSRSPDASAPADPGDGFADTLDHRPKGAFACGLLDPRRPGRYCLLRTFVVVSHGARGCPPDPLPGGSLVIRWIERAVRGRAAGNRAPTRKNRTRLTLNPLEDRVTPAPLAAHDYRPRSDCPGRSGRVHHPGEAPAAGPGRDRGPGLRRHQPERRLRRRRGRPGRLDGRPRERNRLLRLGQPPAGRRQPVLRRRRRSDGPVAHEAGGTRRRGLDGPDRHRDRLARAGGPRADSVQFRVEFSEPVTGVDATDFQVVPSGSVTAGAVSVSGSGAVLHGHGRRPRRRGDARPEPDRRRHDPRPADQPRPGPPAGRRRGGQRQLHRGRGATRSTASRRPSRASPAPGRSRPAAARSISR